MSAARQRGLMSAGVALTALALAGAAHAAKPGTTTTTTDPSCGCTTTTTTPSGGEGGENGGHHHHHGGGDEGGGSGVGYGSSGAGSSGSSSSSSYSTGTTTESSYASVFSSSLTSTTSLSSIATSTTSANGTSTSGTVYNGGGGGSFYVEQGANGSIPNLQVEGVGEAQRVCAEFQSAAKMVAIQASCLDDKDVPHPASQVSPDRDVIGGYEGEVYRCIAGARMQYTIGSFAGTASFDHGQTITCAKNMALYHSASGELACRVQKPARDCNERSLLRRFGAGIKVLKIAAAQQCIRWRTEQVAGQSTPTSMGLDGGVGGVVH